MVNNIKKLLRENLITESTNQAWYHGTPDVRELEKIGGFSDRFIQQTYFPDMDTYLDLQSKMGEAREAKDEDLYFKILDEVPKLKKQFKLRSPIFITNDSVVASTYADSRRSIDYQNANEKVLKVTVPEGKTVTINAIGERFRFIGVNNVRRGFVSAGVPENEFNEVIEKFTYYQRNKDGIKTDTIAILGEWFGFDYIDVVGVLDSYEGGSRKSTVRMVFNPSSIKIIN